MKFLIVYVSKKVLLDNYFCQPPLNFNVLCLQRTVRFQKSAECTSHFLFENF